MNLLRLSLRSLAAVALVTLAGCASTQSVSTSTDNPTRSQFLAKSWAAPQIQSSRITDLYDSVLIAPVNTTHLAKQDWWQRQNVRTQAGLLQKDADALGEYMRTTLTREITHYPSNTLQVVTTPGPRTLIIELAIVELVPSKAFWDAAATAAGFEVPGAGLLAGFGRGSIGMEGRLRDAATTNVVAKFSDQRSDLISPVNLRSYTWYSGADATIDIWAKQGAEFLHAPPSEIIKRQSQFTLRPW